MSKRLPVVETLCNDCGARSIAHTQTDAFAIMQLHEDLEGHMDQMYSRDVGWLRFKPLSWAGCWVTDGITELDQSLEKM